MLSDIVISALSKTCRLYFIECPNSTYLGYLGNNSFCMDVMPSTSCENMVAGCHAIYGQDSMLLQITTYDTLQDTITALNL